jgi:hypothetical protein
VVTLKYKITIHIENIKTANIVKML